MTINLGILFQVIGSITVARWCAAGFDWLLDRWRER